MYGVIYLIRNLINGKCYIGRTINLKDRLRAHFRGYAKECRHLANAIKKYGKENFTVEILHEGIIPELLPDFERKAIEEYNTKTPNGYNLTDGGEGSLNPSEETREKMRQKMLGRVVSKETREKISRSHFGIRPSAEARKKMSRICSK